MKALISFKKSLHTNNRNQNKWQIFKFTCILYIEYYWLLAFLRPLLRDDERFKARQGKSRMPIVRFKPENYERYLKMSNQLMKNLQGNPNFPLPPKALTELQTAAHDLEEAVQKYRSQHREQHIPFFSWFRHSLKMALRMFY